MAKNRDKHGETICDKLLELSEMLDDGATSEEITSLLLKAKAQKGDVQAALELAKRGSGGLAQVGLDALRRQAEQGSLEAALHYGACIIDSNRGDEIARKKAKTLLTAAAAGGVIQAWSYIGDCHADSGDFVRAHEAWGTGIAAGDERSVSRLGCAYYLGKGVPQDLERATDLLRRSEHAGGDDGRLMLAMALLKLGREPERREAQWILERMAGQPKAAFILADSFYPDDLAPSDPGYTESRKLYTLAFEGGIAEAAIPLASRCLSSGSRLDTLLGISILEEAHQAGNSLATVELATAYWNRGQRGDSSMARDILLYSAKQGDPVAQLVVGEAIIHGRFGFLADVDQGIAWVKRSAEAGYIDGVLTLGARTYHGSGVKRNRQAGLQMIRHAAELGSTQAKEMLAELSE